MAVRVERTGQVLTIVHSRAEARNAMDPASADALHEAFLAFEQDPRASVAVLWGEGGNFCAGGDLKHGASLGGGDPLAPLDFPEADGKPPRGPLGPTRLRHFLPDVVVSAARRGPQELRFPQVQFDFDAAAGIVLQLAGAR